MDSELVHRKPAADAPGSSSADSDAADPAQLQAQPEDRLLNPVEHDLDESQLMADEEEEDEVGGANRQETRLRRQFENDVTAPKVVFWLTFLFPPLGFIFFLRNRHMSPTCPRYTWVKRALGLGSALSALYMFVLCSVLHHTVLYKWPNDLVGYGYKH